MDGDRDGLAPPTDVERSISNSTQRFENLDPGSLVCFTHPGELIPRSSIVYLGLMGLFSYPAT